MSTDANLVGIVEGGTKIGAMAGWITFVPIVVSAVAVGGLIGWEAWRCYGAQRAFNDIAAQVKCDISDILACITTCANIWAIVRHHAQTIMGDLDTQAATVTAVGNAINPMTLDNVVRP